MCLCSVFRRWVFENCFVAVVILVLNQFLESYRDVREGLGLRKERLLGELSVASGVCCECMLFMELGVVSKLHVLKLLLRFPLTSKKIGANIFLQSCYSNKKAVLWCCSCVSHKGLCLQRLTAEAVCAWLSSRTAQRQLVSWHSSSAFCSLRDFHLWYYTQ